ncbi:MAG: peptidoglycan DD-metalloendopeptidase family protein [Chitinophagales bacterium]
MKKIYISLLLCFSACAGFAQAYTFFYPSDGIYRVPYADGTHITVTRDHNDHDPEGRIDLNAPDNTPFTWAVVAAADGWIRAIEDAYNANLDCADLPADEKKNNYIWIEHPNGEWTKYTHIGQYSASINAGLSVGDYVLAGTFLGYEGDVGCAAGQHLHFEVAVPTDTNTLLYSEIGGFIDEAHARNLVPRIDALGTDGFTKSYFLSGTTLIASPLPGTCSPDGEIFIETAGPYPAIFIIDEALTSYSYMHANSSAYYQAGNSITLKTDFPGFYCASGAYLHAVIAPCDTTFYRESGAEISEKATPETLHIWPNPTSDVLHLRSNSMIIQIELYSTAGNKLQVYAFVHNTNFQLSLTELPVGNYFLKILTEKTTEVHQISKL